MSKIAFIIKEPGKDSPIQLLYTCYDGRLKYYSGESAKTLKNLPRGTKAILSRIERHVQEMEVDYKIKGDPLTREILKTSLDKILNKKRKAVTHGSMFDQMTGIIDKMEAGEILTPQNKKYSKQSIRTYRFTISLLKRFSPGLTLATTSQATYDKFINWMQSKDYSTNYIGSQIKNWKRIGKLLGGKVFYEPGFKKIQEESLNVYLDEDELKAIAGVPLTEKQAVIRDWFILDCYTGLRVNDLRQLTKKNYSGGFITIANNKTDQPVVIPAHPLVKQIIASYKGFPPTVEEAEMNRTIKRIARKAKITGRVLHTITKGGRRKDEYVKKCDMISMHTSRRSFITNLRKNGVPDSVVMKLTGIRSPLTLRKYDKLTTDQAAKIAAEHKFFK